MFSRSSLFSAARRMLCSLPASKGNVVLHGEFLRVELPSASYDFHYRFLRHNSFGEGALHPQTKERLIDPVDLTSLAISPSSAKLVPASAQREGELQIEWADGHHSTFPLSWVLQHAYSRNRTCAPTIIPANLEDVLIPWDTRSPTAFRERFEKFNFLIVSGGPKTPEGTLEIIDEQFGGREHIISTHFGYVEDLMLAKDNKTNKNTDQLGYTDAPVLPHTDQPFIQDPPSMQMLHCILPAEKGGESSAVDAVAVARYLQQNDPLSFWLLASVPVHFHRRQKDFESLVVAPILTLNSDHSLKMIRYSYFTMDPINVPFELMDKWYEAYIKFTRIVRTPANQYRAKLQSGDYLIYNNHRMLHARQGFSGSRHLRGIYMHADKIFSHLQNKEKLGHF